MAVSVTMPTGSGAMISIWMEWYGPSSTDLFLVVVQEHALSFEPIVKVAAIFAPRSSYRCYARSAIEFPGLSADESVVGVVRRGLCIKSSVFFVAQTVPCAASVR
jgi:hypothetical protein